MHTRRRCSGSGPASPSRTGTPGLALTTPSRAAIEVVVLRHGMAGHKGVEISGSYEDGETVRAALLAAGVFRGLRQGGTKAYFSMLYESAWLAYPLPAV